MSKKAPIPVPDYSTAKPPKKPPLDVTETQLLKILRKRPGKLFTAAMILTVLKEDIDIFDNAAAVIWAATKLEERGKVEAGMVEAGGTRFCAWMVPKPKDEETVDGAPKPEQSPPR